MLLVGKKFDVNYRYGFNGKEHDTDPYGQGNVYDYGFRIFNPRLGKFLSVDPLFKSYPWFTPYQFAGNTPIWAVDLDGLEDKKTNDGGGDPNKPNEEFAKRAESIYNENSEKFENADSPEERIEIAENTVTQMIELAKEVGFDLAANHLEHYMDGEGATLYDDWSLLSGYEVIRDAVEVNKTRLQKGVEGYENENLDSRQIGLKETAKSLEDGETLTYTSETWSRLVEFPEGTDAYYAYGTATLKTYATFTLTRVGNEVTVSATVTNLITDRYDWDRGKVTAFLNRVLVKDEQMSYLEEQGVAEYFNMRSENTYITTFTIKIKQ